jgi:hypothetical protein
MPKTLAMGRIKQRFLFRKMTPIYPTPKDTKIKGVSVFLTNAATQNLTKNKPYATRKNK